MITLKAYCSEKKTTVEKLLPLLIHYNLITSKTEVTTFGIEKGLFISNYMGNKFICLKDECNLELLLSSPKEEIITLKQETEKETIRTKYIPEYRTQDGHFVRSRAEVIIDDWLYTNLIVHSYEKKLPIEEDLYSDFYLPEKKIYIEFWGLEDNKQYLERKKKKLEIYSKYNINLIELTDKDLNNLDDVLPKKLISFGVVLI